MSKCVLNGPGNTILVVGEAIKCLEFFVHQRSSVVMQAEQTRETNMLNTPLCAGTKYLRPVVPESAIDSLVPLVQYVRSSY